MILVIDKIKSGGTVSTILFTSLIRNYTDIGGGREIADYAWAVLQYN